MQQQEFSEEYYEHLADTMVKQRVKPTSVEKDNRLAQSRKNIKKGNRHE